MTAMFVGLDAFIDKPTSMNLPFMPFLVSMVSFTSDVRFEQLNLRSRSSYSRNIPQSSRVSTLASLMLFSLGGSAVNCFFS